MILDLGYLEGWHVKSLGEWTRPVRPRVKPSDFPHLPFIGMEHIESNTMRLLGTVPAGTMKSAAVKFQPGDVLYGRLRPYLNKVFRPDFEGLCSAEFIVMAPTAEMSGGYLQYFLNARKFVAFASQLNTGDRPRVDFDQLAVYPVPAPPVDVQDAIVSEIEKHFTRLDAAVASLNNAKRGVAAWRRRLITTACLPTAEAREWTTAPIAEWVECLDRLRRPISKAERQRRPGTVPYYGANGRTGWIDTHIFDEPLVLVVEDETFTKRELPFSYRIDGKAWVNNHAHVLRAKPRISVDFLNYALSYYPFTALTTGSTGRRKLTQAALLQAPLSVPPIDTQLRIVSSLDAQLSLAADALAAISASCQRAESLRRAVLSSAFSGKLLNAPCEVVA